jgi:prepilin-type N-terminal cleavage/methylation domain-containing protein
MNKIKAFLKLKKIQVVKNNKGINLIEFMIALTILSVGLLGISKMQLFGIQGNAHGNRLTAATILTQDTLEQIKAVIRSGQTVSDADFPVDAYGSIPNFSDFRREVEITPGPDFNTVKVATSWITYGSHTISISTIF